MTLFSKKIIIDYVKELYYICFKNKAFYGQLYHPDISIIQKQLNSF